MTKQNACSLPLKIAVQKPCYIPRNTGCTPSSVSANIRTKNVVKVLCGLGVRIDIRVKGGYVIIPFNDTKRKWWGGSSITDIDEIPFFLKPVTKSRNIPEVWGLGEGDGRNDAMYGLLQALKEVTDEQTYR